MISIVNLGGWDDPLSSLDGIDGSSSVRQGSQVMSGTEVPHYVVVPAAAHVQKGPVLATVMPDFRHRYNGFLPEGRTKRLLAMALGQKGLDLGNHKYKSYIEGAGTMYSKPLRVHLEEELRWRCSLLSVAFPERALSVRTDRCKLLKDLLQQPQYRLPICIDFLRDRIWKTIYRLSSEEFFGITSEQAKCGVLGAMCVGTSIRNVSSYIEQLHLYSNPQDWRNEAGHRARRLNGGHTDKNTITLMLEFSTMNDEDVRAWLLNNSMEESCQSFVKDELLARLNAKPEEVTREQASCHDDGNGGFPGNGDDHDRSNNKGESHGIDDDGDDGGGDRLRTHLGSFVHCALFADTDPV